MTAVRLGVSVNFMPADPARPIFKGKALEFVERRMVASLWRNGGLPLLLPDTEDPAAAHALIELVDGLVLTGGADVSPSSYGESPLRPEWSGDAPRDAYEIALVRAAIALGKPVLGICRGAQLINVAFGGTLYQDIRTQLPEAGVHVTEAYEKHRHAMRIEPGSKLAALYPGLERSEVNSIHHQSIKTLGRHLAVEAWSEPDEVIEAVRGTGKSYILAVQWHPEFHPPGDRTLLDSTPILEEFLRAARQE